MIAIRRNAVAVYNPRITPVLIFLLRLLRAAGFVLLAVFLLHTALATATDWDTPAAQLASKIAAVTGPGAVALDISNHSSLSQADSDDITRSLRSQLAALGLQFVNAEQSAATVQIELSENLQSYVWVAQIHQGAGESSVVMISTPRSGAAIAGPEAAAVVIHKALLWSQADRILDVAVLDGTPTHMAVLDPNQVTLYRLQGNHWQPEQSMAVMHGRPWPRDLRGRLVLRKDRLFDAYLPGVFCRSTAKPPLALSCSESDDPWPLGADQSSLSGFFTPSRNYFTGALAPGMGKQTAAPAFYAAAALPRDKYTLWLFTAVDGHLHLLDGVSDQVAGKLGWGSDIASVRTNCGSGWNVIATANSDEGSDSLRAYDVPDREPVAASPAVQFRGPITALWTEADQRQRRNCGFAQRGDGRL